MRRNKAGFKEEVMLTLLSGKLGIKLSLANYVDLAMEYDDFAVKAIEANLSGLAVSMNDKIRRFNNYQLDAIKTSRYFSLGKQKVLYTKI